MHFSISFWLPNFSKYSLVILFIILSLHDGNHAFSFKFIFLYLSLLVKCCQIHWYFKEANFDFLPFILFFFYFMYLFSNTYYLFPSNIGSSLLFTPCPSSLTCKSYWGLFYGLLYSLVCLRRICMSICYIMLFNYSIFCWFSVYSIIDSGYWNIQPS